MATLILTLLTLCSSGFSSSSSTVCGLSFRFTPSMLHRWKSLVRSGSGTLMLHIRVLGRLRRAANHHHPSRSECEKERTMDIQWVYRVGGWGTKRGTR